MVGICLIGKCHGRHLSGRQMSWSAFVYLQSEFVWLLIVPVGICLIGKCHDREMSSMTIKCHGLQMSQWQMVGKYHGRQMSWSAFVRSANVGRQMSACKCLVGKRRFTQNFMIAL